jgi:hypothetical protein
MVSAHVKIDSSDLIALSKRLSNRQAAKAVARGLNDTIKQGRTVARKAITDRYNIPTREIMQSALVRISGARVGDLDARLFADAKRSIKLGKFRGTGGQGVTIQRKQDTTTGNKKLVSFLKVKGQKNTFRDKPFGGKGRGSNQPPVFVQVVKGQGAKLVQHGFIAKLRSGHVGVFGRSFNSYGYKGGRFNHRDKRQAKWGQPDTPIAEMGTFTLHKAIANRYSERAIVDKMEEALPRRIEAQMRLILEGKRK